MGAWPDRRSIEDRRGGRGGQNHDVGARDRPQRTSAPGSQFGADDDPGELTVVVPHGDKVITSAGTGPVGTEPAHAVPQATDREHVIRGAGLGAQPGRRRQAARVCRKQAAPRRVHRHPGGQLADMRIVQDPHRVSVQPEAALRSMRQPGLVSAYADASRWAGEPVNP